jgi:hypothetical protein
MPSYKEVVQKFYSLYDPMTSDRTLIDFERRENGWWVQPFGYADGKRVLGTRVLFWSKGTRKYRELKFAHATEPLDWENYVDTVSLYEFSVHPYYGYNGWYNDVIKYYNSIKNLNDTMLFSLGRAYTYRALCMFYPNPDAADKDAFALALTRNCASDVQLNAFKKQMLTGIGYLKKLLNKNPNFQTRWGSIYVKYCNDLMWVYQFTLQYKNEQYAAKELRDSLYPNYLLNASRDILNSCDSNSILISFDDNDYYPLLYLQAHEKLRTDVYLLAYNGFCVDRYISFLPYPQFVAGAIKLSFDTSFYKGSRNDVVIFGYDTAHILYRQLINDLRNNVSNTYPQFSSMNLEMTDGKIIPIGTHYLTKCQLIFLDILDNESMRPIYLTRELGDFTGMNQFVSQHKKVWQIQKSSRLN